MSSDQETMKAYYQLRAPVYDRVYTYPERQDDLRELEILIPERLRNRDVLEIAAGTGYWTQFIARQANSVLATDGNEAPLQQLLQRALPVTVKTRVVDAYDLSALNRTFDGVFAGLWFSHVPIERQIAFLRGLSGVLRQGARVILMDNTIAQCERLPLVETDANGNTWQERKLDDGSTYRVIKNFPTEQALLAAIDGIGHEPDYVAWHHFWFFQYTSL